MTKLYANLIKRENVCPKKPYDETKVYQDNINSMLTAFYKENNETKKAKMYRFMRDYIIKNHKMYCSNQSGPYGHEYIVRTNTSIFNRDFWKIDKKINEKLESVKFDENDIALVSVDCDLSDCLSPCINTAINQMRYEIGRNWFSGFSGYEMFEFEYKKLRRQFKKGDIWEYAILSKDRKYFVLVRDLLDKKVQPLENCKILTGKDFGLNNLKLYKINGLETTLETNPTAKNLLDYNTEIMNLQADEIISMDPENRKKDYYARFPECVRNKESEEKHYPSDTVNKRQPFGNQKLAKEDRPLQPVYYRGDLLGYYDLDDNFHDIYEVLLEL